MYIYNILILLVFSYSIYIVDFQTISDILYINKAQFTNATAHTSENGRFNIIEVIQQARSYYTI